MSSAIQTQLRQLTINKSGWSPVKFGDVVFEPKESVKDALKEGIEHVVGLEHIEAEDIHLRRSNSIEESTTFSKKFSPSDVLFGRRRAYLKKAARADFTGICSGDITVMRAKENLLPELLPFIVNNDKFFDWAITHSAGGLSPRCKFKDLANYEFLLPPKAQQAEIAELLWAMDEVCESLGDLQEVSRSAQKSFFRTEVHDSDYKKLKDVASVFYGLGQPPEKDENGVAIIRATDIKKGKVIEGSFLKVKESGIPSGKKIQLQNGDIIIVRSGAYTGDLALIPDHLNGSFAGYDLVIRHDPNEINPAFLAEYLLDQRAQAYFKGESVRSAQPHLNSKQVLNTKIPSLSLDSQNDIAGVLYKYYAVRDELVDKSMHSKSLQKSLINQVF